MLEHPRPTLLPVSPHHEQVGLCWAGNFHVGGSSSAPASHLCALCPVCVPEGSETWPPTAPGIYLRLDLSSVIMKPWVETDRWNVLFYFWTDWRLKESPISVRDLDWTSLWNCLGLLETIRGLSSCPFKDFFFLISELYYLEMSKPQMYTY